MTHPRGSMTDWQALGQVWQQGNPPGIDLERLQADVRHQTRKRIATLAIDLVLVAVAVIVCLRSMFADGRSTGAMIGHLALIALIALWTGWGLWQRRRQWHALDQSPRGLLDFEIGRTVTSLRLARISVWFSVVIAVSLWLAMMLWQPLRLPIDEAAMERLHTSLWALLTVVVVSAVAIWIHSRRHRKRLRRLDRLRSMLDPEPPNHA